MVDSSGDLHLYIDGRDKGVAAKQVVQPCFPVFDIFSTVYKVRDTDILYSEVWGFSRGPIRSYGLCCCYSACKSAVNK